MYPRKFSTQFLESASCAAINNNHSLLSFMLHHDQDMRPSTNGMGGGLVQTGLGILGIEYPGSWTRPSPVASPGMYAMALTKKTLLNTQTRVTHHTEVQDSNTCRLRIDLEKSGNWELPGKMRHMMSHLPSSSGMRRTPTLFPHVVAFHPKEVFATLGF